MNREPVGVVFDGGGFLGAFGVGCMRAVEEVGFHPLYFQGVSVGALNAAKMVEMGGTNSRILEFLWHQVAANGPNALFNKKRVFFHGFSSFLFSPEGVRNLIEPLDCGAVIRSPAHLDIIATNEWTKRMKIFTNRTPAAKKNPELIKQYILASAALPGLLPPVEISGDMYCDGFTVSIQRAFQQGCKTLFVFLNTTRHPQKKRPQNLGNEWWLTRSFKGNRVLGERETAHELLEGRRIARNPSDKRKLVVVQPERTLETFDTIDFQQETKTRKGAAARKDDIALTMEHGYECAARHIARAFPSEI